MSIVKKEKLSFEISIISICQKLGSVRPLQQKIKLPSPCGNMNVQNNIRRLNREIL